jgi:hypothetical protein
VTGQAPEREHISERVGTAIATRLSPARTRRPTLTERLTVSRWKWDTIVRLNVALEILGKTATCVYCLVIASIVLGLDVRDAVKSIFNSGRSLEHVVEIAIFLVTVAFLLARSAIGWCRWRLQRELWRRDVKRLSA